jgi:CO/xanthine dehydrogenase FAD-binding subunit
MTVGGVVAGAGPWSDLPVALLVLDTEVIINGEGSIRLDKLLEIGPGKVLSGKGIITEVCFETDRWAYAVFTKLGRNATDLSLVSIAVSFTAAGDDVGAAAVAVGGLVGKPHRIDAVECYLGETTRGDIKRGRLVDLVRQSLVVRPDARASQAYRVWVTGNLIADAVAEAYGIEIS